ncbi:MAG TPA: hypothetical protein VGT24_13585 [Candidatus Acidoferrales bacterium]|nr:hypothetical protein [Candidatus Acidoferrales bacterium]
MDFDTKERLAGEQLGMDGYDQLVERAVAVCHCERLRIELANRPLAIGKKAEYASELERNEELKARLYRASPPHEDRARQRRIIYFWSVASILVVAGFALTLITLEPYQLGIKGILYSVGIAIATPFLVEVALDKLASERLLRALVTVSGIVALVSLMTLAVIRGELLARHSQEDSAAVVIDDEEPQNKPAKTSFYDDTVPLLQVVMVLLAFSMEVGAGIAVHEARRVSANLGERYAELQRERDESGRKLAQLAEEIMRLEEEPERFAAQFWRDFHLAMLKRTVGTAARAFMVGSLGLLLLCATPAKAERPLELVVLVDLSRSVDAKGAGTRSEFQKNVSAVSQLLREVSAGAHVTVLGITDDSFGRPYFLLSATVASDPGYFGEKLGTARERLEASWKNRSRDIGPTFPATDLFGALIVASQIFQKAGAGRRDLLVIFSDMWQETGELNFGKVRQPCAPEVMEGVKARKLLANLRDADVYALGADSPGRTKVDWACIHEFWEQYFSEAGGVLRQYSVLRSVGAILGVGP